MACPLAHLAVVASGPHRAPQAAKAAIATNSLTTTTTCNSRVTDTATSGETLARPTERSSQWQLSLTRASPKPTAAADAPAATRATTAAAARANDPVQLAADYAAVRAAAAVLQYRIAAGHIKPARR